MSNTGKDAVKNVRDAVEEAKHRAIAGAERARREAFDEEMTPGEKVRSGANEAKHRIQAEVDKGKREIRERT
jgi:hypothetical protein